MLTQGEIMDLMGEMLMVCIKIAAPILIVSILVGLIVAVFQAATQIQEQTLTFVPKVLVIALMLLLLGSWIYNNLSSFVYRVFDLMATI